MLGDVIQRFSFEALPVRGSIVRLSDSWSQVQGRARPASHTTAILGESLVASALISVGLKECERFYIELSGGTHIKSLISDFRPPHEIRGLVASSETMSNEHGLLAGAKMLLAVETGGKQYQSIIELVNEDLTQTLEHYFEQSEQLPSLLHLYANEATACGFLLQRIPGEIDDDDWQRVKALTQTLDSQELVSCSNDDLLHKLFNQDDIRLFPEQEIRFGCKCSSQRAFDAALNLGEDDVREILDNEDHVSIKCEFCGQDYTYSRDDFAHAFPKLAKGAQPNVH